MATALTTKFSSAIRAQVHAITQCHQPDDTNSIAPSRGHDAATSLLLATAVKQRDAATSLLLTTAVKST